MDRIKLYREVCGIRQEGEEDRKPLYQPSLKKIIFNLNELNLYYNEHFKFYSDKKSGGNIADMKILVIHQQDS